MGKSTSLLRALGPAEQSPAQAEGLKAHNPGIRIVGVEPASSPVISQGKAGPHKIQGIGAGFVPDILNTDILDEFLTATNEDAYATAKELARTEGLLVGISRRRGSLCCNATGKAPGKQGQTDRCPSADTGERYLSTGVFDAE